MKSICFVCGCDVNMELDRSGIMLVRPCEKCLEEKENEHELGYDEGYTDCENEHETRYDEGYKDGYKVGFDEE